MKNQYVFQHWREEYFQYLIALYFGIGMDVGFSLSLMQQLLEWVSGTEEIQLSAQEMNPFVHEWIKVICELSKSVPLDPLNS